MVAKFRTQEYIKNRKGFTLVEILLVLFIFLLISSIVFQITVKLSEKRAVDQFFQQLVLDIQEMQARAIHNEETIYVQFYNDNHYKVFDVSTGETILEKDFPSNIKLDIYSNLKRFIINPKGEVSPFGTIKFDTPYGKKDLIIYIKEGRMRLVE
ncbi:competence type IV pilus minor pilin ComGD [Ureibacillus sp. GCM10028918]|uniref:competence type IV pilus minor pilin ComGD n=1 Tax=Ureibacillus sp. GCM10028918 TaxID=3273429 RepID=UPI003608661F